MPEHPAGFDSPGLEVASRHCSGVPFSPSTSCRVKNQGREVVGFFEGTGGKFTSDVDVLARLYEFLRSREWIYKTWEVKVSLLYKDGTARSLKGGETKRTLQQLQAYRHFGSPDVSLLDVYIAKPDS
jgi:NADPH-dependent 2,4-dienoyl-CoA reductase/sulfur reductase-like enzyme